jgi:hypothetical protein
MEAYSGKQFVGIDLHRRRSVIVRTTEGGEVLETVRIVNDVERLASVMARAGKCPEVVLEETGQPGSRDRIRHVRETTADPQAEYPEAPANCQRQAKTDQYAAQTPSAGRVRN